MSLAVEARLREVAGITAHQQQVGSPGIVRLKSRKLVDKKQVMGWAAVGISTAITCFWAYWGIVENFHEGWYFVSLPANLGLMIVQYLSPMLGFLAVTLAAILWPKPGAGLHIALALLAAWFFQVSANPGLLIMLMPLVLLGMLYWFARPRPRKAAVSLAIGLPIATLIIAGVGPAVRVLQRQDDGYPGARLVSGNGVRLLWAPEGPGWPRDGSNWYEAQQACQHLSADGLELEAAPAFVWRLPAAAEAVRSMARHSANSGGQWDASTGKASYTTTPDKESPLWDVHSQVIYWWTATEVDKERAYIIVYDGKVWPRPKEFGPAYLGYRCVKEP